MPMADGLQCLRDKPEESNIDIKQTEMATVQRLLLPIYFGVGTLPLRSGDAK